MSASVFVFNPFAEGYIAHGRAFTPVKHQVMLAADLANLPQFLGEPKDVVLLANRPSEGFLQSLAQAGFTPPEFVALSEGRIDPAHGLSQREFCGLRPWAWGPDSVELLKPLLAQVAGDVRGACQYFNKDIAQLYSKAWSAVFLNKVLTDCQGADAPWLCSQQEVGVVVDSLKQVLAVIAGIRGRGHHRVVVKEAFGLAGHNAIRLWERELSPAQRRWLAHALNHGRQLVVEPWLEREVDFSLQLEMGSHGLKLCGYTGLVNDRKGQFLANWAEAHYPRCLPAKVAALFRAPLHIAERLEFLYEKIRSLLEAELARVGFAGPVGIDAFVYRTPEGDCRLKPVVEINPRYTMGRLTLELMKHACPGSNGRFRLVTRAQAHAEGFADFLSYATSLGDCVTFRHQGELKIRQGTLCLNEPARARTVLATFEVHSAPDLTEAPSPSELRDS